MSNKTSESSTFTNRWALNFKWMRGSKGLTELSVEVGIYWILLFAITVCFLLSRACAH